MLTRIAILAVASVTSESIVASPPDNLDMRRWPQSAPETNAAPRIMLAPSRSRIDASMLEGGLFIFRDDYSTYQLTNFTNPPASLISLNGQPTPVGTIFVSDQWVGAATDSTMMTVQPGEPGGIAPIGNLSSTGQPPGQYMVLARGSGQDSITTSFSSALIYQVAPLAPAVGQAMVYTDDWYLPSAATAQWWSPTSFIEGGLIDRAHFGGTRLGGVLGAFENDDEILDRVVSIGIPENAPTTGAFFSAPRDGEFGLPIGEWFQLSSIMTLSASGCLGYGLWMKTADSVANGFLDPRMASGDVFPSDLDPAGWVNIYPGISDDPKTAVREGVGRATTQFGQRALTTGDLGFAPPLGFITISGATIGEGLDPVSDPTFQPNDAFIDNTTAIGQLHKRINVTPDHVVPYFDDFELYVPNTPLRLQTDAWLLGLLRTAIATPSPEGAGQAMVQIDATGHDVLNQINDVRVQFDGLETRGAIGDPTVVTARLRFDPAGASMTRVVELRTLSGDAYIADFTTGVGAIVFGAADPTNNALDADGMVWVIQPNSDFDPNKEWQDYLVERHWLPADQWLTPPADAPLNTQETLVPTGVAHPLNSFFELRIEIEPDADFPASPPIMRVFIDDAELFPHGDPSSHFVAGGTSVTTIRLLGASPNANADDLFYVDDVVHEAPLRALVAGPSFSHPYIDDFSAYATDESIHNQGDTPFLALESVPDHQSRDHERMMTVIADASAEPQDGDLVCRYEVEDVFLNSGLLAPRQVVAIPFGDLPSPHNTVEPDNLDCPGAESDLEFVIRNGHGLPRLETGAWLSLNAEPVMHAASSGDVTGYRYDFFTESRWRLTETRASARVVSLAGGPSVEGGPGNHALEIQVLEIDDEGELENFPMHSALTSILPAVHAAAENGFGNPGKAAQLCFDLYIESLDEFGSPSDFVPPRSRLSVPILGAGGNAGRITTIMFGGPNMRDAQLGGSSAQTIAPDLISVAQFDESFPFDLRFEPTGVSLQTGGAGEDGVISGPLLNRWIRVVVTVNSESDWTVAIDEDRDGPLTPVTVAAGLAIDHGEEGIEDEIVNTSGFDGFNVDLGLDVGSGAQPLPRRARIETLPGEEFAVAPANADPIDDYCFYEFFFEQELEDSDPPMIARPSFDGSTINGVGPISDNTVRDVIAVLNRRTDGAGMVIGPKIHERCPWDSASGVNQFAVLNKSTGEVQFHGQWSLRGRTGFSNLASPAPAGGIAHTDGTIQNPPRAYNDPFLAPADYSGVAEAEPILLATWADDEHNGWDPMPPVFPQQRWLIDNVRLEETQLAPPCPDLAGDDGVVNGADLAQLLAAWGTVIGESTSDFNGDGVVNGSDLATLLANWGTCDRP